MKPLHPLLQFGLPPDGASWAALCAGCASAASLFWIHHRRSHALTTAVPEVTSPPSVWRSTVILVGLASIAAALSALYVHYYLRGGPRIIDATAYFLQGRALAAGDMSFEVPAPTQAFRGRFLVPTEGSEPSLGVLFPPGYPALLALGFLLGRPLWIGPLLAASLVFVTYALAERLSNSRSVALLAATLSALSAALRYHTADTMSHGWAALLFTTALWAALGPRTQTIPPTPRPWALRCLRDESWVPRITAGLCVGWLLATRPLTGLVCGATCIWLIANGSLALSAPSSESTSWFERIQLRRFAAGLGSFGLALLPGLGLLLWHQEELTGAWWRSVQLKYYALADGPPGCFGLGLGSQLGCHYEHGDVVARFGSDGFGLFWALRNTLHRLHHHALDFSNFELTWLLVPWAFWRLRQHRAVRALLVATLGVVVAYGGFYFSGNYPGGGGRFFAELLPLEHALVAWAVIGRSWSWGLVSVALVGFACHGSYSHRDLAEREGGRPLFEAEHIEPLLRDRAAGALVFVDTDHGFNLGHDPTLWRDMRSAAGCNEQSCTRPLRIPPGRVLVARRTKDANERLLWQRLGRPPTFFYDSQRLRLLTAQSAAFESAADFATSDVPSSDSALPDSASPSSASASSASSDSAPSVGASPVDASPAGFLQWDFAPQETLRFELENEWPPLALHGAWLHPSFPPVSCVSGARALNFHHSEPVGLLRGELNAPKTGSYELVLGAVVFGAPSKTHGVRLAGRFVIDSQERAFAADFQVDPCLVIPLGRVELSTLQTWWTLEVQGLPLPSGTNLALDYLEIRPVAP